MELVHHHSRLLEFNLIRHTIAEIFQALVEPLSGSENELENELAVFCDLETLGNIFEFLQHEGLICGPFVPLPFKL